MELLSHKVRTHPDREKALVTTIEGRAGDVVLYHRCLHGCRYCLALPVPSSQP